MFSNSYRKKCIYALKQILKREIQDSTLLQAYVTFQLMKDAEAWSFSAAYQAAVSKAEITADMLYSLFLHLEISLVYVNNTLCFMILSIYLTCLSIIFFAMESQSW